jgi:hypothetical protein
MCFSAPVSFVAAAALGAIGVASIQAARSRRHVAFAAIPLIFAAQQACEGALWLALAKEPFHVGGSPLARMFLFFALFVWPFWIPTALAIAERDRSRRIALSMMAVAGGVLGVYLMTCVTFRSSNACIAFGNLYYWIQLDAPLKPVAPLVYIALIAAPLAISSMRGTSVLGAIALASFLATAWLTRAGFISVWCFFAAILSGVIALIARPSRGTSAPGFPATR